MRWLLLVPALVLVTTGCGTVAGNPKKPKDQPPSGVIRFSLPTLDFDFDDAVVADVQESDQTLLLRDNAEVAGGGQDKQVFNDSARRLLRVVRQVNALSQSINAILEQEQGVNPGEVLRFRGKGERSRLDGKMREISDPIYEYEATLCIDGTPFRYLRWRGDASAMTLTQDFSAKIDDGAGGFSLVSTATVSHANGINTLDLMSSGSMEDLVSAFETGNDGSAIVEHMVLEKSASSLSLRSVLDRFQGVIPAEFEGERYLVGRLNPLAKAESQGLKSYTSDFIAWSKHAKRVACQGGVFNETATDLWEPDGNGPEFCIGRRATGKRFRDIAEFAAHTAQLKPIGILSKTSLGVVTMPNEASCD